MRRFGNTSSANATINTSKSTKSISIIHMRQVAKLHTTCEGRAGQQQYAQSAGRQNVFAGVARAARLPCTGKSSSVL